KASTEERKRLNVMAIREVQLLPDNASPSWELASYSFRTLQVLVGDRILPSARGTLWEGYARERFSDDWPHIQTIRQAVRQLFPCSFDHRLDWEYARLLAILEDDD